MKEMKEKISISEKEVQEKLATQSVIMDRFSKEYPNLCVELDKVFSAQAELLAKKSLDYGISNVSAGEPLDNEQSIRFALNGLWYRINDKVSRWKNHVKGAELVNESLYDTLQDIANYAIIAQVVAQGKWR